MLYKLQSGNLGIKNSIGGRLVDLLEKLFILPLPEERHVPYWFLRYGFMQERGAYIGDDVYIFYRVGRNSFLIACIFALLNELSKLSGRSFNFYLFDIDLSGVNYVRTFLSNFTSYTATVLLLVVLPYYLFLFRFHIDPRKFDLLWWNTRQVGVRNASKIQVWLSLTVSFLAAITLMYGAFAPFSLYMKALHLENSYPYLVFCMVGVPLVLSLGNYLALFLILVFWRYSGPHLPDRR